MDYARPDALVSTEWLADRLGDPDVAVIDASFHLPTAGRNAAEEFAAAHIPGAVYFDLDDVAEPETDLPHMVPSEELFAAKVGALGINNRHRVIAYDVYGGPSAAARAWWMFRLYGHDNVAVLNGGLPKWRAEGRPIESGAAHPKSTETFSAKMDRALLRTLDEVRANLATGAEQIVDARSAGRFHATEPEFRPGLRGGHIPGSINLDFSNLIDRDGDGGLKSAVALAAEIAKAGIDPARPVACTCGSGVTACVPTLALYLLGHPHAAVYDGSWTEWGGRDDTPIET
jgi:thiosulfate/3-mercaptopyruvate sulfurtransferase